MKKKLAWLLSAIAPLYAADLPDEAMMQKAQQQCNATGDEKREACLKKAGLNTFKRTGSKLEVYLSKGSKVYKDKQSDSEDMVAYTYEDFLPALNAHYINVWLYEDSQTKLLFSTGKEITLGGPFKVSPDQQKALWVNLIEGEGTAGITDLKTGKLLWELPAEIQGQPVYQENDTHRHWPFTWKSNTEAEIQWNCDYNKHIIKLVIQQSGSQWKLKGKCPKPA